MSREFRLVRAGKCPTSSMRVILLLYCLSPYAQSWRGAYKLLSSSLFSRTLNLSLLREGPPFYTSRWGPRFTYFYRDILVRRGVLCLHQSAGPARSVGSGEAVSGRFSWAMGYQAVVPSWSVGVASALGRGLAVVLSPVRLYGYLHPYCRRTSFPTWFLT